MTVSLLDQTPAKVVFAIYFRLLTKHNFWIFQTVANQGCLQHCGAIGIVGTWLGIT